MKRLFEKLLERFSDEKPAQESVLRKATSQPRPKPIPKKKVPTRKVDYSPQVSGKIADGGPGKNVFVPSKYHSEKTDADESLKILDDSLLDLENNEGDGIDPYNTGRFDRSKFWDATRFRK